jgi:hypothetical protein
VQFGSLIVILLALFVLPSQHGDNRYFYLGLGAYLFAKVFEFADRGVYQAGQVVSGHTIKHLMAAVGLWFIVVTLARRVPR